MYRGLVTNRNDDTNKKYMWYSSVNGRGYAERMGAPKIGIDGRKYGNYLRFVTPSNGR
jgi:hypothetical protein